MNTQQLDDDDLADDDYVTAYRARLKGMLDEVTRQAKLALAAENLNIPLFFVLPNSGSSIVNFGTPGDPDDATWERTREIGRRHYRGGDRHSTGSMPRDALRDDR